MVDLFFRVTPGPAASQEEVAGVGEWGEPLSTSLTVATLAVPSSERPQWTGLGLGVAGGGDVYFGKLICGSAQGQVEKGAVLL